MIRTLLHGHVSPETAYVVQDYPFGFRLRCKIRYWIETADKGAKKGAMRFVSQTTDPRKSGEFWNKPKAGTYHDLVVMFVDEVGHVHCDVIGLWAMVECFAQFRQNYGCQLSEAQAKRLELLEAYSRRSSPTSWAEWDAKQANTPANR
ncbi:MAG TPA: hypothetical protein VKU02_24080 [Gemmataceae bacterium]|nr:hypothetical protein [Gemmataceae bacterium]